MALAHVDAAVKDVWLKGILCIELEWVRPYPYLGAIHFSFVRAPELDFKLTLFGSPDLNSLVPHPLPP